MSNKYLADIMTYLSQKQNTADVSAATAVSSFYYIDYYITRICSIF